MCSSPTADSMYMYNVKYTSSPLVHLETTMLLDSLVVVHTRGTTHTLQKQTKKNYFMPSGGGMSGLLGEVWVAFWGRYE